MNNRKILFTALVLLAVAGLALHYRIHNFMTPDKLNPGNFMFDGTKFLSFIFPMIDVVVVTLLFASRKTAVYGYLLNGLLVIWHCIHGTFQHRRNICQIHSARGMAPEVNIA